MILVPGKLALSLSAPPLNYSEREQLIVQSSSAGRVALKMGWTEGESLVALWSSYKNFIILPVLEISFVYSYFGELILTRVLRWASAVWARKWEMIGMLRRVPNPRATAKWFYLLSTFFLTNQLEVAALSKILTWTSCRAEPGIANDCLK